MTADSCWPARTSFLAWLAIRSTAPQPRAATTGRLQPDVTGLTDPRWVFYVHVHGWDGSGRGRHGGVHAAYAGEQLGTITVGGFSEHLRRGQFGRCGNPT